MKTQSKRLDLTVIGTLGAALALLLFAGSPRASAVNYFNGFETDIADWQTPTRVVSGTDGITSSGGGFHATTAAGANDFSRWGGYNYGAGNLVPTIFREYFTSVDIYLNINGGWANDTRFDFDSAINDAGGAFRRDFIFNGGFYTDTDGSPGSGTPRFVISASNNSQPGSAYAKNPGKGPIAIATTGWYTFQHHFYNLAGVLAVDLSIFNSSGLLVKSWTLTDPTDLITLIGGNRYGWFDCNQFATLAFDNAIRADIAPVSSQTTINPCSSVFDANHVVGVPGDAAPGFGTGSLASDGVAKTDMYLTPDALFGRAIKLGEVKSMSYWTKKGATHLVSPTDWFLNIYTKPYAGQLGGGWYGTRIGCEPYLSENMAETAGTWNQWTTDGPNNYLRFFESTYGYYGGYVDPHWTTFVTGNSLSGTRGPGVPYASQEILFFSPQTASSLAAGFIGRIDGLSVELLNGSIATINFEASAPPVASETAVTPSPVAFNYLGSVTVTAKITAGDCEPVVGAQFKVDGGTWTDMAATDLAFGGASEGVTGTFTLSGASIGAPGVYNVCVRGTDVAGLTSSEDCILLAVYDPSAGFVTGAGWINSPPGAYTPEDTSDADLVGKATFGFVSQYKKAASVPTGSTEFQFNVADLSFRSSGYYWLVVAGSRAQYKGVGKINGAGNFGFLLTAIDGQIVGDGIDKFRIKIWDQDNGDAIVYDNKPGSADTSNDTTVLGGGSIVIHKK